MIIVPCGSGIFGLVLPVRDFWTVTGVSFLGTSIVFVAFLFIRNALSAEVGTGQKIKRGSATSVAGVLLGLGMGYLIIPTAPFWGNIGWGILAALAGILIVWLIYSIVKGMRGLRKDREERRKEALAWELKDRLEELKEQLDRGTISQEEYEQEKNKLQKRSL